MVSIVLLGLGTRAAADPIVVGGEAGYRPYESLGPAGEPVGFNIDLMRAVADATGSEVRFRLSSWETMREALQTGEIDVLGMFVSEQRAQQVDFARPHLIVHHRIFIPATAERINSIEELAGRSVIVQRQAYSHEYLQSSGLQVELVLVETDAEGLELLARGGHDAALLTEYRSRYTLQERRLERLAVSGPPVLPVEYALAVREGNQALLETLNRGLDEVMSSGEFDRIYARWLQPYSDDGSSDEAAGFRMISGVIALALVMLCLWLLVRLLMSRRQTRQAQARLVHLTRYDRLTGLLSRHAFERQLEALCEQPSAVEHVLLHINVDRFRIVNDTVGHAVADEVLRALADRLKRGFPAGTPIARLGADEFAVLLPERSLQGAVACGEKLLADLHRRPPEPLLGYQHIGLSIGLVSFQPATDRMPDVLRRVDCACLAAKEDGGDRVHVWKPDDRRLAERFGERVWIDRIHHALSEQRMRLYWQPIVAVGPPPHRIKAVEILIRMQPSEAQNEPIAAAKFMPAAERYFLAQQIDRWVLDSLLDWMRDHEKALASLDRINVNLSGRSLGDRCFLDHLGGLIDRHRDLLGKLCLEVTETALISNLEQARTVLERAHRGGCSIALDDFGTGVSSMSYLRHLPVDCLKIDGIFVRDIAQDRSAFEFIREINRLAQTMGKVTVAECVETGEVAEALAEAGIDRMQGYLIGRPAPIATLPEALADSTLARAGPV
ncbi:MAG: EAL domain-containing protein [Pseudomonadota bacterium]|nr:MAG: EAL domain-containing protein [Pseudomonadota bacterium]